jgi:predicted membrane channel-forming protein YqfA (hemolysin III family)
MIPQFKLQTTKPSEGEELLATFLSKRIEQEKVQRRESWVRAAMFCSAALLILYTQSFTRNQEKVSEEDLGLVYTLYSCSLLLLVGMSVLWQ